MQFKSLHIIFIGLLLVFSFIGRIAGQDIHYSQFYNSPQNLNPAQTGIFNGDHRFILSHRDQWRFVPVPWTTFSGAYDRNIIPYQSESHFYGVGGNINYDRQGDSRLTLLNVSINGAFHKLLNAKNILSLGANLGLATKGFDTKSLRWDKQWNGDIFDTNLGSQEAFQSTERISYLETGIGINYRYQKSDRTNLDLGIAALHLVEPKVSFLGEKEIKLPRRYTFNGVGNFQLTNQFDIQLHALHQIQGEYNETVLGGLGKIYLNQNRGKELQLHLGLGYRTSGSLIPTLAFQYNEWYLGANIDFDSTPFNNALDTNRGAYELHLRYIIKNVRPFKFKNCPIL
ncbi:MAG: PorP/SprF family type IX secretion system membrane protein [Saprospiraceae bacterium]|jgi:type IX secretion system PorP/SprF family membrane protein|nr:PorP/SprF family type IX secretion system membrane protein [Saprospiraceae bacterium]